MDYVLFIKNYFFWHYGRAFREIWQLEENFLWFGYHFFSMPVLWRTLFFPFYRIREPYKGWVSFEALLENVVANGASRMIGFVMRTIVITIGVVFECALFLLLLPAYFIWIILPVLVPGLFLYGVTLLF